jgi:hypothetical protein
MERREAAMSHGKLEIAASRLQVRPQQAKQDIHGCQRKRIDHSQESMSSFKGGIRPYLFKIPIEMTSY